MKLPVEIETLGGSSGRRTIRARGAPESLNQNPEEDLGIALKFLFSPRVYRICGEYRENNKEKGPM